MFFWSRIWLLAAVCLCVALTPAIGQQERQEPLTEAQQDQIAEAGIAPGARIGLYTKFLGEHAATIESVGKRVEAGRGRRLDSELQDFSALVDELASNLDEFGERKADMRKALKDLNEAVRKWQGILAALPRDAYAEISLSDATEALNDLADQARQLATEQEAYFKEHKDAAGQQREEPK